MCRCLLFFFVRRFFLDTYQTEDEQIEALKKWWGENGASIIVGVVLGLGAIFGWRYWSDTKRLEAENVSDLYQSLMVSSQGEEDAVVQGLADEIITNYSSTPYAVFAKLALASRAVDEENYDLAQEHLRWALDNVSGDSLGTEVRLRLARVMVAQNNYDEAIAILDENDPGTFIAAYEELRGDIKKFQGDISAARVAYQKAIVQMRMQQSDTNIIEVKLNDLGRN
jgi:predicted negative regulator of RcsB-dependent stress response